MMWLISILIYLSFYMKNLWCDIVSGIKWICIDVEYVSKLVSPQIPQTRFMISRTLHSIVFHLESISQDKIIIIPCPREGLIGSHGFIGTLPVSLLCLAQLLVPLGCLTSIFQ